MKFIRLIGIYKKIDCTPRPPERLMKNVPDPRVTNHIFYADLTPEEVVDKALAYKPIQL